MDANSDGDTASSTRLRPAPGWQLALVLLAGLGAMAAFATLGWGGLAIVISSYAAVVVGLLAWAYWSSRRRDRR